MRVLVCGGRDYEDAVQAFAVLDHLHHLHSFSSLIHGGAAGADRLAAEWAKMRWIHTHVFEADWSKGPAAGPQRNQRMIDLGYPEMVVVFPGGKGTWDMTKRARAARVKTIRAQDVSVWAWSA